VCSPACIPAGARAALNTNKFLPMMNTPILLSSSVSRCAAEKLSVVGEAVVNETARATGKCAYTGALPTSSDGADSRPHTGAPGNDLRRSSGGPMMVAACSRLPYPLLRGRLRILRRRLLESQGRRFFTVNGSYVARNCVGG
jgi:hypothetical protein